MKVILDHNVPRQLRPALTGHEVRLTKELALEQASDRKLMQVAADNGFDLLLTLDKNIEREHNLDTLPMAVLVLDVFDNKPQTLLNLAPRILEVIPMVQPKRLHVLTSSGTFKVA
ncbi:MAG: DUF5615 family PIN-like protein [Planctomycetota bacterium]